MIEFSFYTFLLLSAVVAMLGFGVGLFIALMILRSRVDAVYEGKVTMVGVMQANVMKRRASEAGNRYPNMVLNVTFGSRRDGWATLQVEDDNPLRRALEDASVRDVWRISVFRVTTRSQAQKDAKVIDWRDTDMAKAFGGKPQDIG